MIEQQFLTTFNNIGYYPSGSILKDKKTNLLLDFINGTYQGFVSSMNMSEPEGLGTVVDDQFNFIISDNWKKGKINGNTFIKLASEITIWGMWANGMPQGVSCVKVGMYVMFIPYAPSGRPRRPKKCLICHQGKQQAYISTIERYPEGTQSKREYSIVIQKIISIRDKTISEVASTIDLIVQPHEQSLLLYLGYLCDEVDTACVEEMENGLFVRAHFKEGDANRMGYNLGLLLDKKKLVTKSVGMYSKGKIEKLDEQTPKFAILNGIGLSKTMQSQTIIGIFKDDMLVRQLNAQQNIDNIRNNSKNYARNLNGSIVKQLLGHQHMRSLSYQHNCLYFPQIKKITAVAVELHKYVEMFERLTHQEKLDYGHGLGYGHGQSVGGGYNESMNQHPTEKYSNQYAIKMLSSSGSGSIIDQYPEFKVNLAKEIYRDTQITDPRTPKGWKKDPAMLVEDQDHPSSKRPGFIFNRTTRTTEMGRQRNSRSPSGSPQPRLNKKLDYTRRSPLKTEPKWKI